jgi:hypothetical protein
MWSIGVLLSSDGVRVRNFLLWTGRFIPWSDIDRFDWGKLQRGPSFFFLGPFRDGYPTGGAYLRSGAFVPSLALNPPLGPGDTIWAYLSNSTGSLLALTRLPGFRSRNSTPSRLCLLPSTIRIGCRCLLTTPIR